MATQVQFRGGTTTEHASFNGAAREVTVDTTKQTLVVQDGTTNGGFPLLRENGTQNLITTGSVTGEEIIVKGASGQNGELHIQSDNGSQAEDKWVIMAAHETENRLYIGNYADGGLETNIRCQHGGEVELRFDESPKFVTTSAGAKVSGRLQVQNGATDVPTVLLGANSGGSGMNNNSTKYANICAPQYLSDTQTGGFRLLSAYGNSGASYVYIGGNSDNVSGTASAPKSATEVRIFTAATATGNGVEALRIDSNQDATFTGNVNLANTKTLKFPGAASNAGAYIKHQSGNFELKNQTGNFYFDNIGALHFRIGSSYTTALTLDTSQNAIFAGQIKVAAGYGIDFSANSDTGRTVTSNVFDEYEEGSWTPANSNLAITNNATATFTRVGRLVTVIFDCTYSSSNADTSDTGGVITGLPFEPAGSSPHFTPTFLNSAGNAIGDNESNGFMTYVEESTNNRIIIFSLSQGGVATRSLMAGMRVRGFVTYTTNS